MNPRPHDPPPKWWHSGWVKAGLIAGIFIGGFYAQQNLLGALAWKKVLQDVAAAGESLDPASLIPPPVPDEENLGVLPIFHLEPDPHGIFSVVALKRAIERVRNVDSPGNKSSKGDGLPYLGNWGKGEKSDRVAVHARLAELCQLPATTTQTSLQLFAQLCPLLAELREASKTHPVCLFCPQGSYPGRKVSPYMALDLVRVLGYEEQLALLENHPDLAFEDLKLSWKVNSGFRSGVGLGSAMLYQGMGYRDRDTLVQGLAEHQWSDSQLAEMDLILGELDCLEAYLRGFRGLTMQLIPTVDQLNRNRAALARSSYLPSRDIWNHLVPRSWAETFDQNVTPLTVHLIPSGWVTQFKADAVRYYLLHLVPVVDPRMHRVFPEQLAKANAWLGDLPASALWRFQLENTLGDMDQFAKISAYQQVQTDEARLACRLERYRRAHGVYPAALADVESVSGSNPKDLFTGEAYRYRLKSDGSYLLYSVGWNQKDDGGQTGPGRPSRESLDWVWFTWR